MTEMWHNGCSDDEALRILNAWDAASRLPKENNKRFLARMDVLMNEGVDLSWIRWWSFLRDTGVLTVPTAQESHLGRHRRIGPSKPLRRRRPVGASRPSGSPSGRPNHHGRYSNTVTTVYVVIIVHD